MTSYANVEALVQASNWDLARFSYGRAGGDWMARQVGKAAQAARMQAFNVTAFPLVMPGSKILPIFCVMSRLPIRVEGYDTAPETYSVMASPSKPGATFQSNAATFGLSAVDVLRVTDLVNVPDKAILTVLCPPGVRIDQQSWNTAMALTVMGGPPWMFSGALNATGGGGALNDVTLKFRFCAQSRTPFAIVARDVDAPGIAMFTNVDMVRGRVPSTDSLLVAPDVYQLVILLDSLLTKLVAAARDEQARASKEQASASKGTWPKERPEFVVPTTAAWDSKEAIAERIKLLQAAHAKLTAFSGAHKFTAASADAMAKAMERALNGKNIVAFKNAYEAFAGNLKSVQQSLENIQKAGNLKKRARGVDPNAARTGVNSFGFFTTTDNPVAYDLSGEVPYGPDQDEEMSLSGVIADNKALQAAKLAARAERTADYAKRSSRPAAGKTPSKKGDL